MLRTTKAKIIFATSTPVQEALFTGVYKRLNKDNKRCANADIRS